MVKVGFDDRKDRRPRVRGLGDSPLGHQAMEFPVRLRLRGLPLGENIDPTVDRATPLVSTGPIPRFRGSHVDLVSCRVSCRRRRKCMGGTGIEPVTSTV